MKRKVALIIGGSGGIGMATAKRMLAAGIEVCSTYYRRKERVKDAQQEINNKNIHFYQSDICDEQSTADMMKRIKQDHTDIDILVFCPTLRIEHKNVLDMDWNEIEAHLQLQVGGLHNLLNNLREQIQAKHTLKIIIVLTEYCIGRPPSKVAHYVVAKYGLMGYAKVLAIELAQYGCTVNMVSPGMVQTDLLSNLPPKLIELTSYNNPLGRIASPEDVANVILFLVSEESNYLNGTNILVNGGNVLIS